MRNLRYIYMDGDIEGWGSEMGNRRNPVPQNDQALSNFGSCQCDNLQVLRKCRQRAEYTITQLNLQLPSNAEPPNEEAGGKLENPEELLLREAKEEIIALKGQVQKLKEILVKKEKEEHAKVQSNFQWSENLCDSYEIRLKGYRDNSDWVYVDESLRLAELSGTINSDELWNVLTTDREKSLCLLQFQLSIKTQQLNNKTVDIKLQRIDGTVGWGKRYSSMGYHYGTWKDIRVQLGIHGSRANIIKYLSEASILIEVYAPNSCEQNDEECCTRFYMDFSKVLEDPNYTSSIAMEDEAVFKAPGYSLQGTLQLWFYSQDSQASVASGLLTCKVEGNESGVPSTTCLNGRTATTVIAALDRTELKPSWNIGPAEYAHEKRSDLHSGSPTIEATDDVSTKLESQASNRLAQSQDGERASKPFKCRECGQRFQHASSLSKHKLRHKEGNGKVPCKICGMVFSRRDALLRHMRRTHREDFAAIKITKSRIRNPDRKLNII